MTTISCDTCDSNLDVRLVGKTAYCYRCLEQNSHSARPEARFIDLQRRGFMRPYRAPKLKAPRVIVACKQCQDWHPKGKHSRLLKYWLIAKWQQLSRLAGAAIQKARR